MEEKFKKIRESIKAVSLTTEEKEVIKGNILTQMDSHISSVAKPVFKMPRQSTFFPSFLNLRYAVPLLLIFMLSSGVSFAAERSFPGDSLYFIKTGFNERLAGIFIIDISAKAQREAELVNKRFKEAQTLALRGEFSEDKVTPVQNQITIHTKKFKNHIEVLEKNEKFEEVLHLEVQLEIFLRENERVLDAISLNVREVDPIVFRAREELSVFSAKRIASEVSFNKKSEIDNVSISGSMLKEALNTFSELEEAFNNRSESLKESGLEPSEAIKSSQEYLELVEEKITEGEILLNEESYKEALILFGEAHRLASEAKLILETESLLEIKLEPSLEIKNRLDIKEAEINIPETVNIVPVGGEVKGEFKSGNSLKYEEKRKKEI